MVKLHRCTIWADSAAGPARFAAWLFRVVTQDDAPSPTIRLRVSDRGVKHRAFRRLAVKLRADDQRQIRLERKAIHVRPPGFVVNESSMLPRPVLIVVQGADETAFVAHVNLEGAFHSAVGDDFTRTRFGTRASSTCRPMSSRLGSTKETRELGQVQNFILAVSSYVRGCKYIRCRMCGTPVPLSTALLG